MGNPATRARSISPATVLTALFAAALLSLSSTGPAAAADDILADPACCSFAPGPFTQALGETPNMVIPAEADAPHNVVSTEAGPDGNPLFAAPTNLAGTTTPVAGARYLEAGTYPFFCTLHGPTMSGDLVVDGSAGTAVPRPKVKVAFPARKLKAIRKKGVRVRLKAVTEVPSASIQVRLVGKGLVGERIGLGVGAGKTRTVVLRLSKKLKKSIRKRRAVKFRAVVNVEFGSPASATRKFR